MSNRWALLIAGVVCGAGAVLVYSWAKRPAPAALSPLPAPYYTVLFENDHVRVVEHRLNPGEREPMHSHPPMVVYFMEHATVRIGGPDGGSFEEVLTPGQVLKVGELSHTIENLGDTRLHSILVELKSDARLD